MSEKIDAQGAFQIEENETFLNGLEATLNAAIAAKKQTDPARFARHIGQEVYEALHPTLDRLTALQIGFAADRLESDRKLDDLVRREKQILDRLRDDLAKAQRWKKRVPFIALFGLVLVLGLSIALPRFLASHSTTCAVIGAAWTRAITGVDACVFYAR